MLRFAAYRAPQLVGGGQRTLTGRDAGYRGGTVPGIEDVDLLVVGGGKAGKSLAMDRAKAGWSVAMIERDKVGGTCINVACIPTKSLVASARTLLTARRAGELGIEIDAEPAVSLERLRAHKEGVVGGMVAAHRKLFAD